MEYEVEFYSLPSIRVEVSDIKDKLFKEIIHTTNEADGVFLGINEFILPTIYNQFFYRNEVNELLNNFIFGD